MTSTGLQDQYVQEKQAHITSEQMAIQLLLLASTQAMLKHPLETNAAAKKTYAGIASIYMLTDAIHLLLQIGQIVFSVLI